MFQNRISAILIETLNTRSYGEILKNPGSIVYNSFFFYLVNEIIKIKFNPNTEKLRFNTNPGLSPILLYVRCKLDVPFVRRCFRDANNKILSL